MKKSVLVLIAVAVVVAGYFALHSSLVQPSNPAATAEIKSNETGGILPKTGVGTGSASTSVTLRPAASPTSAFIVPKNVIDVAPSLTETREEVAANPHGTPPSLLSFAASLGPRLDEALRSPDKAEPFFNELVDCVEAPHGRMTPSAQALCLANVRRLGQKIPAFRDRAAAAAERADPEVVRLAR